MIPSSKKLVQLPSTIWKELKEAGYNIPPGNFNEKYFIKWKLNFDLLVKNLAPRARQWLLFMLLQVEAPMNPDTAERMSNAYSSKSEGRALFLFYAEKLREHKTPVEEVPSKIPEAIEANIEEDIEEDIEDSWDIPEMDELSHNTQHAYNKSITNI